MPKAVKNRRDGPDAIIQKLNIKFPVRWKCINCGDAHSAAWAGYPEHKEKLKEIDTKMQIKTYSQVTANNISINDKLIKESNFIKANYIKINTLIDILTWLVKNTSNKQLNLPPQKIKDVIEYIVLKTYDVKKKDNSTNI